MRRVFVVIERRADYSRYRPILQKMKLDPFFDIYLVVTGLCLLDKHGRDIQHIIKDGFEVKAEIPMFFENDPDTGAEMVKAMGRVMIGLVEELEKAQPDLVLSGFDIGANFAVTVAAAHMNIPVFHIQGGEITGSIDESIRHAMSKFAHVHLPATELSRERLIKMGERPEAIHVVGCPSIDVLMETPYIDPKILEIELGVDFSLPLVMLIQHPVTTEASDSFNQIKETIDAIKSMNVQCVALLPNNDAGHAKIIEYIKASGLKWIPSLSTEKFVNLYRNAWAIVGNSSSGIHESSTMKIPAVNIGTRQQGRERAANVIDVPYDSESIKAALEKALFDQAFRNEVKKLKNPYGSGNSAEQIVNVLKTANLSGIIQKMFYE